MSAGELSSLCNKSRSSISTYLEICAIARPRREAERETTSAKSRTWDRAARCILALSFEPHHAQNQACQASQHGCSLRGRSAAFRRERACLCIGPCPGRFLPHYRGQQNKPAEVAGSMRRVMDRGCPGASCACLRWRYGHTPSIGLRQLISYNRAVKY